MTTFAEKYGAAPFDPSDPCDQMGERARQIVIEAFWATLDEFDARSAEEIKSIIIGLTVGIAGVMEAHIERSDAAHAVLRASFIQLIPLAIDMLRASLGLPPLPDLS